ncbi:MAG: chemotaxis protein CheW [Ignavibacteriales bacterium CG_4_9_14_3_um_filter_34_10]|nr:MAG: chemotaxis protein CheW [Ignavibacteriales bacterium CG_4_9_14_3_um_filter_34_10]
MEIIQKESQELLQLVSFNLGSEEFGIDILKVQEIIRLINITKVPNSPEFIEGVINLRGRVIPVIALRIKLGMEKIEYSNSTRIIVVEINNNTVGFVVDGVSEVLRIPANITEAPPSMVAGVDSEYITAVGKLEDRLLILLDLEKILAINEHEMLKNT